MKLSTKKEGQVFIIEIEGEIMGGNSDSEEFKKLIFDAIEEDLVNIVVDLAKAIWMNSSGLGMLISGLTTVRSSGGDLCLANVSERVRRPLEITRLDFVFSIHNSVREAVASFDSV